jgi:predicted RNA-binding Zn ribbon-like protein
VPEVPDEATLIADLCNTIDVETGEDDFASPDVLRDWLSQRGLVATTATATGADLAVARRLRGGLRRSLGAEDRFSADGDLDEVAAALPLVVESTPAGPRLRPLQQGVRGGLSAVLAASIEIRARGQWDRLKPCRSHTCEWIFFDASKNRSRTWCDMQICGNRQKTRTYRERHRHT